MRKWAWLLMSCLLTACQSLTPTPQQMLPELCRQSERPWPAAQAKARISVLEKKLPLALQAGGDFPAGWVEGVAEAIAAYQFYYFLQPTRQRRELLLACYAWWEQQVPKAGGNVRVLPHLAPAFDRLRDLLAGIEARNARALQCIDDLLAQWEKEPDAWLQVARRVNVPMEIGGVVLTGATGTTLLFVEDQERQRLAFYLEELRANRFDHLHRLEAAFVARFQLQQIGADAATELYTRVAGDMAKRAFAVLRHLASGPRPFSTEVEKQIAHHKNNLFALGLESRLLNRTYHMDKSAYLDRDDTALFFHSHPHQNIPHYNKGPSGHDEEMSFRIGPCLVFAVEPHQIGVYSIIAGTSRLHKKLPAH